MNKQAITWAMLAALCGGWSGAEAQTCADGFFSEAMGSTGTCAPVLSSAIVTSTKPSAEPDKAQTIKKALEARIGGQEVRQPEAEQQWLDRLGDGQTGEVLNPHLAPLNEQAAQMRVGAQGAFDSAKIRQQGRIETYSADIFAKVKTELESAGYKFDEKYFRALASSEAAQGEPYADTRLFVFVSESLPALTMKNLAESLEGTGAVMVLRGPIGEDPGKFMPTQAWVQQSLCKGEGERATCLDVPVDINPNLFRLMNVEEVPAIAYVSNPTALASCGSPRVDGIDTPAKADKAEDFPYLLFYGDMAPHYVLQEFLRVWPHDGHLAQLVNKVRPSLNPASALPSVKGAL